MKITLIINSKGLCLIEAEVAKELGQSYDDTIREKVMAMIDTGAGMSAVSRRLAEKMNLTLGKDVAIRGFEEESSNYVSFHIFLPSVIGENNLRCDGVVKSKIEESGFDLIIGGDFLRHCQFERNGPGNTFTLKIK